MHARNEFRRSSAAIGVLPALALLVLGAFVAPYTVDDAFIIGRYALRLASGQGYTFEAGPPTDGVTGPLFLGAEVLAAALGFDPVAAGKGLGFASGAIAVFVLYDAAKRRVVGSLSAPIAALFLVLAPSYATWCVSGLETGVAALAALILAVSAVLTPRPWRAGIAAAILVTLRPESIPLAAALASYLVRRRGREALAVVIVPLVALGLLALFRLASFGTLGPLSAAAKPPDLANGAFYAFRVLTYGTALVALPLAVLAARGSRRMRVLGVSLVVHLLAITLAGGDWMPGVRLFVPALPLLSWMVGVGIADLARRRPSTLGLNAAIALVLLVPLGLVGFEAPRARESGAIREDRGRALAAYLDAHAHRVALIDIGFLGYVSHVSIVDLAGITDPSIGRLAGAHLDKPVTGAMLIDRGVDAIVLHAATEPTVDAEGRLTSLAGHPIERRLAMDENVRSAFVVAEVMRYAEGYWYAVLLRRPAHGSRGAAARVVPSAHPCRF